VTFRSEVKEPTSLVLAPVLNRILAAEIPHTVDTLVEHP